MEGGGSKKKRVVVVAEDKYFEATVLLRKDVERWLRGAVKLDICFDDQHFWTRSNLSGPPLKGRVTIFTF